MGEDKFLNSSTNNGTPKSDINDPYYWSDKFSLALEFLNNHHEKVVYIFYLYLLCFRNRMDNSTDLNSRKSPGGEKLGHKKGQIEILQTEGSWIFVKTLV